MVAIVLSKEEEELRQKVRAVLDELWLDCKNFNRREHEEVMKDHQHLGKLCHELHSKLTQKGFEPRHHKYMLENRGVLPNDPDFYAHIHPAEDLLKFIQNPGANDDKPDLTLDSAFEFSVYTNRWGHYDTYTMKRIRKGWDFSWLTCVGECKKDGRPLLYKALKQDSVSYPRDLHYYIERIWEMGAEGSTFEEMQKEFNSLSKWISTCERASPDADRKSDDKFFDVKDDLPKFQAKEGSITILDVLGWKGIWNRDARAIIKLQELVKILLHFSQGEAIETTKRLCDQQQVNSVRGLETKILIISDTIVITTYGESIPSLILHGEIGKFAICESLSKGIPLRGATCYGKFQVAAEASVFVGPAVDEAAEWHEHLDWSGMIQTPSAMLVNNSMLHGNDSPWEMYEKAPTKATKLNRTMAVSWPHLWMKRFGSRDEAIQQLKKTLLNWGPIGPSIAPKALNTLDFFEYITRER